MPGPLVTVLVPTFDHERTLEHSIGSALAQDHADLEVLVAGDGSGGVTERIVRDLTRVDGRVRYVAFPKGERHGELHRHEVLMHHARGEVICYLADDDLWLPRHVSSILQCMEQTGANFVCAQPVWTMAGGSTRWIVDLALSFYREELLAGRNRVPLSCAAHTAQLYRELPHGWRTTPAGTPTDLFMWQQFLRHPECRAASTDQCTVVGLPASQRAGVTPQQRLEELARWTSGDWSEAEVWLWRAAAAGTNGALDHAKLEAEYITTTRALEHVQQELAEARTELAHLSREHRKILASRGWRQLERLRRMRRRITLDRAAT